MTDAPRSPIPYADLIEEAKLHALGLAEQAERQRLNKRMPPHIAERTASRVPAAWAIVETLRLAALREQCGA